MKRASRKNKLAVGAFVTVVGFLIVVATLFFGDDLKMFKSSSQYFAAFRNTSGLHAGAPVKMGGVDIGTVEAIAIESTGDTTQILLTLLIYAPHNTLIKQDSVASLETQGMLGDKFLNVKTGTVTAKSLPAGSFLRTKEATEMSSVVSQSTDIIKTVDQTTVKIGQFVDTLPDAKTMKALTGDFQASANELKVLLASLNAEKSGIQQMNDAATATRFIATLTSLQKSAEHLESITIKIDSGKGTLGALVNDPALYDDMRQLMGRANRSKAAKFIIQQMLDSPSAESNEK